MDTPSPENGLGSTGSDTGQHRKAGKENKKGRLLRFYVLPEDDFLFEQAMRESGYSARSHLILNLLHQSKTVSDYQDEQAERLIREAIKLGISQERFIKKWERFEANK